MGLQSNSYEAYCVDEAVWYFGTMLNNELDKAGHKPSKEERKSMAARQRVLDKVFGPEKSKKSFRDPMSMI